MQLPDLNSYGKKEFLTVISATFSVAYGGKQLLSGVRTVYQVSQARFQEYILSITGGGIPLTAHSQPSGLDFSTSSYPVTQRAPHPPCSPDMDRESSLDTARNYTPAIQKIFFGSILVPLAWGTLQLVSRENKKRKQTVEAAPPVICSGIALIQGGENIFSGCKKILQVSKERFDEYIRRVGGIERERNSHRTRPAYQPPVSAPPPENFCAATGLDDIEACSSEGDPSTPSSVTPRERQLRNGETSPHSPRHEQPTPHSESAPSPEPPTQSFGGCNSGEENEVPFFPTKYVGNRTAISGPPPLNHSAENRNSFHRASAPSPEPNRQTSRLLPRRGTPSVRGRATPSWEEPHKENLPHSVPGIPLHHPFVGEDDERAPFDFHGALANIGLGTLMAGTGAALLYTTGIPKWVTK